MIGSSLLVFRHLTPAAPDPAALRFRLGEGRAKIALLAWYRVKIRRAGEPIVSLLKTLVRPDGGHFYLEKSYR